MSEVRQVFSPWVSQVSNAIISLIVYMRYAVRLLDCIGIHQQLS